MDAVIEPHKPDCDRSSKKRPFAPSLKTRWARESAIEELRKNSSKGRRISQGKVNVSEWSREELLA